MINKEVDEKLTVSIELVDSEFFENDENEAVWKTIHDPGIYINGFMIGATDHFSIFSIIELAEEPIDLELEDTLALFENLIKKAESFENNGTYNESCV